MSEPLLKAHEVADRLGMSTKWVLEKWEAYARGDPDGLPGFRLGPRAPAPVRFRWSEIEAWLRSRRRRNGHDGDLAPVTPIRSKGG